MPFYQTLCVLQTDNNHKQRMLQKRTELTSKLDYCQHQSRVKLIGLPIPKIGNVTQLKHKPQLQFFLYTAALRLTSWMKAPAAYTFSCCAEAGNLPISELFPFSRTDSSVVLDIFHGRQKSLARYRSKRSGSVIIPKSPPNITVPSEQA